MSRSPFPFLAWDAATAPTDLAALMDRLRADRDQWLARASEHGAVLFEQSPLRTGEDFDAAIAALDLPNFPYAESLSNAVRVNITERVFTANEAPPETEIFFHHEMAQTPLFPRWILFFCEVAPEQGGTTPLCRSDWLYDRLATELPDFVAACKARGLQYTNVMPGEADANSSMGRSWRNTLGVADQAAAEARLQSLAYTFEWRDDGSLAVTTPPLPAVAEHASGRKVFFSQLIAAFAGWKDARNDPGKAIRHGDGRPLDREAVQRAIAISNELAVDVVWQPGSFALIDNTLVMHARKPFRGKRRVLASLAEMQRQSFAPAEL